MAEGKGHLQEHVDKVHGKFHKLIAKAWEEESFKARLLEDPTSIFAEYGIELPDGVRVQVLENTTESWNFVLPANCAELAEEELQPGKAAASCVCTCCCGYTVGG